MSVSRFDEKAAQWDENPARRAMTAKAAEAIVKAARPAPAMRALEFGAGTGALALLLGESLGEITLCDSSRGMLDRAREKIAAAGLGGRIKPLLCDLEKDPPPAGPFDLIYSVMALHHVADTLAMLRRFASLLTPGGRLALIDLELEDGSFHGEMTVPHNGFDTAGLKGFAVEAGFDVESVATVETLERHGRAYPLFLLYARRAVN